MKRYLVGLLVLIYITLHCPKLRMVLPTKSQFDSITDELKAAGITDQRMQLAILGLIGTEGGYNLREESSYSKTSASRLRAIFGGRLRNLTDEQLDNLKQDDVKFFAQVYGGRYGNDTTVDGWRYRGRGFNQLTFKNLYRQYSLAAGVDLVSHPDKMNDPKIATKVLAAFIAEGLKQGIATGRMQRKFGTTDLSRLPDQKAFNRLICQINAGWGTDITAGIFTDKNQKLDDNVEKIAAKYLKG